jgi:hypothetical protein
VGAALGRGDQVDVALGDQLAPLGQPGNGPVDRLGAALEFADQRRLGQQLVVAEAVVEVVLEPVLVAPLLVFRR